VSPSQAISPDALQGYVRLREHSRVPIAGGEVLTRRQSFEPLLEASGLGARKERGRLVRVFRLDGFARTRRQRSSDQPWLFD